MIRQLIHSFKTEHGAPRSVLLSPTTLVVGRNGSGKTALTQALNAVVYGSVPEIRGKRVSGTESMALLGCVDEEGRLAAPMRVDALFDTGYETKTLFWCIESEGGRKTPKRSWVGVEDEEGEGVVVDTLLHDLLDMDSSGEDKAVVGWLRLVSERMGYAAANELLPRLDADYAGNVVQEALALLTSAEADVKRAKAEMERIELLESAGVVVGTEAAVSAKMALTVAEQRKKVAKSRVAAVWARAQGVLSEHLRQFSSTRAWETWLRRRVVAVDMKGRLTLGGKPVMSGAETWMARLVVLACFVWQATYCLVTIEDDPFDDYAKLHWPEPLVTGEAGVQVVITSAHDVVEGEGAEEEGAVSATTKVEMAHVARCRTEILRVLSRRIAVVDAPLVPGMWLI